MVPGEPSRRRSGRSHEAFGDGRPRGMAITATVIFAEGGTEPGLHAVWHLIVRVDWFSRGTVRRIIPG